MRRFALVSALAAAAVLIAPGAFVQAHQRVITIHNDTGFAIVEFYGAIVRSDSWGESRLDGETLAAGEAVELLFDDHDGFCVFNFRAVFEDGDEIVTPAVNVCDEREFYYRP